MKYCEQCGAQLEDEAKFCPYCGIVSTNVENEKENNETEKVEAEVVNTESTNKPYNDSVKIDDESNAIGFACLAFLFPIVGFILFATWKDKKPKTAKYSLIAAIIGFIINIIYEIISAALTL